MHKRGTSKLGILPRSWCMCVHEQWSEVFAVIGPVPEPWGPFSSPAEQDDDFFLTQRGGQAAERLSTNRGAEGLRHPQLCIFATPDETRGPGQLETTLKLALSCQGVDELPSNRFFPPTFFYYFYFYASLYYAYTGISNKVCVKGRSMSNVTLCCHLFLILQHFDEAAVKISVCWVWNTAQNGMFLGKGTDHNNRFLLCVCVKKQYSPPCVSLPAVLLF